jgi:hypothetical protein
MFANIMVSYLAVAFLEGYLRHNLDQNMESEHSEDLNLIAAWHWRRH